MNDDIKEIIKKRQQKIEFNKFLNVQGYYDEEDKALLDYITKLQQENQDLSRMCELYGKSLYNAELTDYKSRIEKADWWLKEMLKQAKSDETKAIINGTLELLLNGRSDE